MLQLCLRVRLDSPRQLYSPHLTLLRCSELRLPALQGLAPAALIETEQATVMLLKSPAFRRQSGACLQALLRVPPRVLADGVLAGQASFPALRQLSLTESPNRLDCLWAPDALTALPGGLHTLQLPSSLSLLMSASNWQLLPSHALKRLVVVAAEDLVVGCQLSTTPCPIVAAQAGRTATILLEVLPRFRGSRRLEVEARWAVLSSPDRADFATLAAAAGAAGTAPAAQCIHRPSEAALAAWLAVLAPYLAASSLKTLECTTQVGRHACRGDCPGALQGVPEGGPLLSSFACSIHRHLANGLPGGPHACMPETLLCGCCCTPPFPLPRSSICTVGQLAERPCCTQAVCSSPGPSVRLHMAWRHACAGLPLGAPLHTFH